MAEQTLSLILIPVIDSVYFEHHDGWRTESTIIRMVMLSILANCRSLGLFII